MFLLILYINICFFLFCYFSSLYCVILVVSFGIVLFLFFCWNIIIWIFVCCKLFFWLLFGISFVLEVYELWEFGMVFCCLICDICVLFWGLKFVFCVLKFVRFCCLIWWGCLFFWIIMSWWRVYVKCIIFLIENGLWICGIIWRGWVIRL